MPVIPNRGDGMATPHLLLLFAGLAGRRYTREMTNSLLTPVPYIATVTLAPARHHSGPWSGLTERDETRIDAALTAAYAETTRTVYAFAWRRWVCWCTGRGIIPLPAEPAAVCAYLTDCADQGRSLATIDSACSAIGHEHRTHGLADPIEHDTVRRVRRGLRRILGRAPRHPAHPLSLAEMRQVVAAVDHTTVRGVRDTAILLIGFAGALRRSELAALTLADLEPKPTGVLVHLRRSKTDQEARGEVVGIARGRHALTDPLAALDDWLALRGGHPGPVFTSLRGRRPSLQPISGNAVSNIVKERAAAAGLTSARVSGHSLRAGHATTAALAGISVERIAAQTRHRRIDTLIERYIRPAQALQTTSSRDLGL
jgi:integrase